MLKKANIQKTSSFPNSQHWAVTKNVEMCEKRQLTKKMKKKSRVNVMNVRKITENQSENTLMPLYKS